MTTVDRAVMMDTDTFKPKLTRINVLLVEDDRDDAEIIQAALEHSEMYEFNVHWEDRVRKGVEALIGNDFDVVLADMFLPDAGGMDSLKALATTPSAAPVILLTGLRDDSVGRMTILAGAEDFISKGDMDPRTLEKAIIHAIERKRRAA